MLSHIWPQHRLLSHGFDLPITKSAFRSCPFRRYRHVDFALLYRGIALAYCPDMSKLEQVLAEVQPVIFVGVPRVYEKIRRQVIVKTADFPKNAIYRWALSVVGVSLEEKLTGAQPR